MRILVLGVIATSLVTACGKGKEEPPSNEAPSTPPPVATSKTSACTPGEHTCVGDKVAVCAADGKPGVPVETCKGLCRAGACVDSCALKDVELVYVVDDNENLYSFDPKLLPGDPFHKIANLGCEPSGSVNSMAVSRDGVAYLNYHSGKVYRASITSGQCSTTGVVPSGATARAFGMGFVTDGPKATTEKLFVAGGPDHAKALATIDTSATPPRWLPIGALSEGEHPELTGTGEGRLFAYFPAPGLGFVQELDRTNAEPIGERWTLAGAGKHVSAYAFAHWGGVFYVFATADQRSFVHAIHMNTGAQELVRDRLPMTIVGAGVSTCAPLLERVPE
jgi:hypothetical protein